MSFTSSSTYVYTYVVFAVVYLVSAIAFVVRALRVSATLSRARTPLPTDNQAPARAASTTEYVSRSQRLVDYTQLATLLPLIYIVGSLFLGSLILNGQRPSFINVAWVAFTVLAAGAAVTFAVLGTRESMSLSGVGAMAAANGRAADIFQRIGIRLGVSAALLLLVAVFTMLNLFSILGNMDALLGIPYLL
ncbi:MAG: hypothetical protein WBI63_04870 [Coriobacteriia bacterium]